VQPDKGYIGEGVAAAYDERSANMFDPAVVGPAVDRLAELAGDGRALEFAIGTGRIALPLAERGVRVAGIDNSQAMLARLSEKPGSERIDANVGDMAATRIDGDLSLVYLVFNTNLQPDRAGRPGRLLRERRGPPAKRWEVRDRGTRARASTAAARPDRPALAGRPHRDVLLRLRRR
jgi:SAM-dependent methyltransferase